MMYTAFDLGEHGIRRALQPSQNWIMRLRHQHPSGRWWEHALPSQTISKRSGCDRRSGAPPKLSFNTYFTVLNRCLLFSLVSRDGSLSEWAVDS
jgi:hypothetical protein